MHGRGYSDRTIARGLGCSRETVFLLRRRLGLPANYRCGRRTLFIDRRAREAELDRLWARLSLDEKTALLLER
jgi:hypothetical protein